MTLKVIITELPALIFPSGIPVLGLDEVGVPFIVTLPATNVVPFGGISVKVTLLAVTSPLLVTVKV